ncbi:MAG: YqaJ viral recombinase family protein [Pseudoclavibacter sp.]
MVTFLPSFAAAGEVDREAMRPAALATYARAETLPHVQASAAASVGVVWRPGGEHSSARPHEGRIVADSAERDAWLRARTRGITATDAAKLATPNSIRQVVRDKLEPSGFSGNAYTEHGRQREPHIASWVLERHGIPACGLLYHSPHTPRHLATPDGLFADDDRVLLAEIKTTGKPWKRIPRSYLRQVWWQQYVLGAERTLFVWEQHTDFVVHDTEPRCVWVERDDDEISKLVTLADLALAELDGYLGDG